MPLGPIGIQSRHAFARVHVPTYGSSYRAIHLVYEENLETDPLLFLTKPFFSSLFGCILFSLAQREHLAGLDGSLRKHIKPKSLVLSQSLFSNLVPVFDHYLLTIILVLVVQTHHGWRDRTLFSSILDLHHNSSA
jgi:hypothetical protein